MKIQSKKERRMTGNGRIIQGALPVFDGKMFDDWRIKMMTIFGFQDVSDVIVSGLEDLGWKAKDF